MKEKPSESRVFDTASRLDDSQIQTIRAAANGTKPFDKFSELIALKEEIKVPSDLLRVYILEFT